MGLGGISIWQLLIVLVIVLLLFGTKRLKGLGGDLGGAIKGFKKAMGDDDKKAEDADNEEISHEPAADQKKMDVEAEKVNAKDNVTK